MKTLSKFETSNCIIKVEMRNAKDLIDDWMNKKLYIVTTTPKHKNTWKEYYKEFNFSSDANKYMMEEIYWNI